MANTNLSHPSLLPWHSTHVFFVLCSPLEQLSSSPSQSRQIVVLVHSCSVPHRGNQNEDDPRENTNTEGCFPFLPGKTSIILLLKTFDTIFVVLLVFISQYQAFYSHFLTDSDVHLQCDTPSLLPSTWLRLPPIQAPPSAPINPHQSEGSLLTL